MAQEAGRVQLVRDNATLGMVDFLQPSVFEELEDLHEEYVEQIASEPPPSEPRHQTAPLPSLAGSRLIAGAPRQRVRMRTLISHQVRMLRAGYLCTRQERIGR